MLRLVFVDMDGTFLDSSKAITPENAAALDAAAALGVQFVPCTGRNVGGLPPELLAHPSVRYAVCANGAIVSEVVTGRTLREVTIRKDLALDLYRRLRDRPITFDVFADGRVYTECSRFPLIDRLDLSEATKDFVRAVRTVYDESFEDLLARVGDVCRLNVFYLTEEDRAAACALVDAEPTLRHTSSLPCNIEITDRAAHKGAGLRWLCDHLGVDPADCVAFGDGDNDRTMLAAAGDGVAMANACAATLAAADHVTDSCDESGVARDLAPLFSALARERAGEGRSPLA